MEVTTYINVERFADGSGNWLWQVCQGTRVWRAGIAPDRQSGQRLAAVHLAALQKRLRQALEQPRVPDGAMQMIDFDKLDASQQEDER